MTTQNVPRPRRAAPPAERIVTCAVGNTRTCAAVWTADGRKLAAKEWPTASGAALLARRVRALCGGAQTTVILASVVPKVAGQLERLLRGPRAGKPSGSPPLTVLRFQRDLPCPLVVLPHPAAKVGDDRLAAALGALCLDPTRSWVVLDAGTALTVNAVRSARDVPARKGVQPTSVFEGGLIVPGEALALRALHSGTAQLPALQPWPAGRATPRAGCCTATALRAGVRRAQTATAVELARAQAEALGRRTRVALTGGGAAALWPAVRKRLAEFSPLYVPDLVLRGLLYAAGPRAKR